ncbi:hypothetical protein [Thalassospira profundimaris]|uniref:hypothetical protein n=1 Tax=Thalassospira profundimaris TaxID=502049 RepID=UPI0002872CD6|nr:hypothetical protein [Thalassospira profundimaris]EKF09351.1 hypothetical protein TH2_05653 [Thalassospira profundimaris WP0211]
MTGKVRNSNKFKEIVEEFYRIRKLKKPYIEVYDNFPIPRQLQTDGRDDQINISKKIDQLIEDIACEMQINSPIKNQFSKKDFRTLVRETFGPALHSINLDDDIIASAKAVQTEVETRILDKLDIKSNHDRAEYTLGCRLFTYNDFFPFQIGPVRFEPRSLWLNRKASDGNISNITKRRIVRIWDGFEVRKRKRSRDNYSEQEVLKTIGECPYVCSVKIPMSGPEKGEKDALLAARLALTSLALAWPTASSALSGLNLHFDQNIYNRYILSFFSDGSIQYHGEKSSSRHAPFVSREDLETRFKEYAAIFKTTGEAIDWVVSPIESPLRPKFSNITAQALLWFHDGCREIFDLKAIVCFAACLDILACGSYQKGIHELIHARLGWNKNTTVTRDDLTVKDIVEKIYSHGRNRFSHGPLDQKGEKVWDTELAEDWSDTRQIAEWLARRCLISCMDWMANHPNCDVPRKLRQL